MSVQFLKNKQYYKSLFFLDENTFQAVIDAGKKFPEEAQSKLFKELYSWMDTHPIFKEYYTETAINKVKQNEASFWSDIICPSLTDEYIAKQQAFGNAFSALGVPLEAYVGAIQASRFIVLDLFNQYGLSHPELINAFHKETAISVSIITDTYNDLTQQAILEKNAILMELSTPVTQLWNGILLLPLVGIIDSKRAQDVMTAMLTKIADTQARVFILDISGIAVVDTAVANYLIKMTKATQLMGCRCLISGISGAVAQTIVELGIQIDEVETTGNMQDALRSAFEFTGIKI